MQNAQFIGGPLDGSGYFRGSADWQGTVVAANPERYNASGVNVFYQWNGRAWVFARYVERGEDIAALCWPKKRKTFVCKDEQ